MSGVGPIRWNEKVEKEGKGQKQKVRFEETSLDRREEEEEEAARRRVVVRSLDL